MNARKNDHHKGGRRSRRRGGEDDARELRRRPGRDRGERVVYVACEGEQTEPDYLGYLNETFGAGADGRKPFHIYPLVEKNGLLPTQTVAKAKKHAGIDEAWVLFDRDGSDRDADISQALRAAAEARIEVGFSHPSFDLWLLLHFQGISGAQRGSSALVVEKLRNVKETSEFRDYDKRNNKSIDGGRRDALNGKEATAVRHARALVGHCEYGECKASAAEHAPVPRRDGSMFPEELAETESDAEWTPEQWSVRSGHAAHCPILRRDPSTDVWRLLVSLGIVPAR